MKMLLYACVCFYYFYCNDNNVCCCQCWCCFYYFCVRTYRYCYVLHLPSAPLPISTVTMIRPCIETLQQVPSEISIPKNNYDVARHEIMFLQAVTHRTNLISVWSCWNICLSHRCYTRLYNHTVISFNFIIFERLV